MGKPQQLDLLDPQVIHCDDAPVANLSQFLDYVQRTFGTNQPFGTLVVSPPIPLRSGFGWYVGRAAFEWGFFDSKECLVENWWYQPYDRMSDYYATEHEAADAASWHRSK